MLRHLSIACLSVCLVAASADAQEPVLSASRAESDFKLNELFSAARTQSSFDQGLTAEWILQRRFIQEGLNADSAAAYFVVALEARVKSTTPDWFKKRLRSQLLQPTGDKEPSIFADEFNNEDAERIVARLELPRNENIHLFGVKHDKSYVLLSTDKIGISSDLYFVPKAVSEIDSLKVSSFRLSSWCPAFESLNLVEGSGAAAEHFRRPSVTIEVRADGKLVLFDDAATRLFISLFDPVAKKCELSFVTVRPNEAACIDCIQKPRPTGRG